MVGGWRLADGSGRADLSSYYTQAIHTCQTPHLAPHTLAITEAAAIQEHFPSPLTTASEGHGMAYGWVGVDRQEPSGRVARHGLGENGVYQPHGQGEEATGGMNLKKGSHTFGSLFPSTRA